MSGSSTPTSSNGCAWTSWHSAAHPAPTALTAGPVPVGPGSPAAAMDDVMVTAHAVALVFASAAQAMVAPSVPSVVTATTRPHGTRATSYVPSATGPVGAARGRRTPAAFAARGAGCCTSTAASVSATVGELRAAGNCVPGAGAQQGRPPASPPDIDECGTEMAHCRANQFCVNTEGSYECRDCSTACIGCMGAGPARCKKCNKGYWRDGAKCLDVDECASAEEPVCTGVQEVCENTEGSYRCVCARGHVRRDGQCVEDKPPDAPEKGFFDDVTEDEVVVLQQMFFGVMICALATLAAKGDMVFTAIFIGAVAAMAGYWLSDRSDRVLDGFMKGR